MSAAVSAPGSAEDVRPVRRALVYISRPDHVDPVTARVGMLCRAP